MGRKLRRAAGNIHNTISFCTNCGSLKTASCLIASGQNPPQNHLANFSIKFTPLHGCSYRNYKKKNIKIHPSLRYKALWQTRKKLPVTTEQAATRSLVVSPLALIDKHNKQTCRASKLSWTTINRSQSMHSAPRRGVNKATLHPDVAIRQQRCKQPRVSGTIWDQKMTPPHLVSFHFCLFTHKEGTGSVWALILGE